MHITSLKAGEAFSEVYSFPGGVVLDIGGQDCNGSLRSFFEKKGMRFICMDMVAHHSVDIVVLPGQPLPFEESTVDLIVSTSCFEHDPFFWLTFREMTRVIKPSGYIYVNAPTSGRSHYIVDSWRFYPDAGQALACWSGKQIYNETIYPVKVIETFNILGNEPWNDFVCIWKRVNIEDKETDIYTKPDIINNIGSVEKIINNSGLQTRKKVT